MSKKDDDIENKDDEFLPLEPLNNSPFSFSVVKLIVLFGFCFLVLALIAFFNHDPSAKWRDPYDNRDVVREHHGSELLAQSSCVEFIGVSHMPDFRIAQCLKKKITGNKTFRRVVLRSLKSISLLRQEVDKLRSEGVREFPIMMDNEINSGFVSIVGCIGPRIYLGGIDDTIETISGAMKEKITRESLWAACK